MRISMNFSRGGWIVLRVQSTRPPSKKFPSKSCPRKAFLRVDFVVFPFMVPRSYSSLSYSPVIFQIRLSESFPDPFSGLLFE